MSPKDHYLRVEAVNLAHFVSDNQDLSAVRGGSLLLLDAVRNLHDMVKDQVGLNPISIGASIGFYQILLKADQTQEQARDCIEHFFAHDERFRHATFMVDVSETAFLKAREELVAKNRWRQMKSPSLATVE